MKPWIWNLLTTIQANQIIFPAFFAEDEDGTMDSLVDQIEPELKACTDGLGLPYIRPEVSRPNASLLMHSYTSFIRRYLNEVRRACRCGANYVYL